MNDQAETLKVEILETGRGKTVKVNGRFLYSKYDPLKAPEKAAEEIRLKEKCLYFIPSPLLGHGINKLLKRLPESSAVLTVEISQEIMYVCSSGLEMYIEKNLPMNQRHFYAVRLSDSGSLKKVIKEIGIWRFRKCEMLILTGGININKDIYTGLYNSAVSLLSAYWKNRIALNRFGRHWIKHIYSNLINLSQSSSGRINFLYDSLKLTDITGSVTEKTVIIAGAGESLENSMDIIKKHRNKLIVAASDTALSAFLDNSIIPDIVFVLETQAWNLLDFHGFGNIPVTIIADISAYPPSLTATEGRCYIFSSDFADLDFLRKLKKYNIKPLSIPPLGSVGIAAIELILKLTDKDTPVLLTGLDFAYVPGKSHARGTSIHKWQLNNLNRFNSYPLFNEYIRRSSITLNTPGRIKLKSDPVLLGYADILKDRYSDSENSKRMYVISPGGADTGLNVIEPEKAGEIINNFYNRKKTSEKKLNIVNNTSETVSNVQIFLNDRAAAYRKIISTWEKYIRDTVSAEETAETLRNSDEIFCDFPDTPPLPNTENTFLVRAVKRTRELLRLIEKN